MWEAEANRQALSTKRHNFLLGNLHLFFSEIAGLTMKSTIERAREQVEPARRACLPGCMMLNIWRCPIVKEIDCQIWIKSTFFVCVCRLDI